jgi:beta-1,4-N-acetylglucosaminyltransferase
VILVSVGTNEARFDRLLHAVETLTGDEPIFVQHGASPIRPKNAECVDFLPFEAFIEKIGEARAVVTHAGVGSVMVALSLGRRPIVMPRLKRYGEAVDDHQLPLAHRLKEAGLVTLVEDLPGALQTALDRADMDVRIDARASALSRDLRGYLLDRCRA